MTNKKIFSLLGLATRSRNVVSGEFMTEKSVKEGTAKLVIVAEDASDNTKKEFSDMCSYRKVPYAVMGTKEELGKSMGKEMRASLSITDQGFAEAVIKLLQEVVQIHG
ncbi:MAG: ribosomal L7Ae/L30e/S12e/Gadd45 family protein [Lachnospiraceae bacterium]|nr:ribosomal L7Ae/L30e/S12e/Gadd45 family protein [Lachnospiraceae bacterium]